MKYTLQINQFLLGKFEAELREAKIDYNDLMIISLLLDRVESGDLRCMKRGKKDFYQMNCKYVRGNLPFLKMGSYNAYRYRLDKLEKAGLIELFTERKRGGQTLIRPTEKICIEEWFYNRYSKKPITKKFSLPTTKKFSPIKVIKNKGGKPGFKTPGLSHEKEENWYADFKQNLRR